MPLLTRAESSHYEETSRHADVKRFVEGLDALHDPRLYITSFGVSGQGRDLPLLVLSAHRVKNAAAARRLGLPVVLIISGIHAGEVEGKEACLMLARDLLGSSLGDLLSAFTLVVVPLFNPDGNDAIDRGNRRLHLPRLTGQLGPDSGVGTRVNASGINLNRDYMRQESVEMRRLQAQVCQVWEPDLTIDNHATNGSIHRYHMTYDVPHTIQSGRPEPIVYMRDRLLPPVTAAMRREHGLESGWYGNFVEDERVLDAGVDADPTSGVSEGWMTYPHHPRFGGNYRGLTGRMDLLLECYSYISFHDRVRTAYAFMLETLRYVAANAEEVRDVVHRSRIPRAQIAVRARLDPWPTPIEILTRSPRILDGSPTTVTIRHFAQFIGTEVVERPRAYLVPPPLADHLRRHGLALSDAAGEREVQIATVEGYGSEGGRAILEAARVGEAQVSWSTSTRAVPEGWSRVDTEQPLGAIAVYLCEPCSDDGAVENGILPAVPVGGEHPAWREL